MISAAGATPRGREVTATFHSVALSGPARALVVLPSGYDTSGRRYPVVYFLHGLPASPDAYRHVGWLETALRGTGREAILVAPQGAHANDTDPEYLDSGPGRNWESYVAGELPAYVDRHFRTIATRRGRALVGLSAGGYGAVLLGFHRLDRFGAIESWSGYFHPTDPTGTKALDRGPRANVHTLIRALRADERRRPTFFAFYVGRGDRRFRNENVRLDRELDEAHVPHVFQLYAGGHDAAVWKRHARAWLGLALDQLAAPRG